MVSVAISYASTMLRSILPVERIPDIETLVAELEQTAAEPQLRYRCHALRIPTSLDACCVH